MADNRQLLIIAKGLRSGDNPSESDLVAMMECTDAEVKTLATTFLLDNPHAMHVFRNPEAMVVQLCVPFFLESIIENRSDPETLNRFEGAHYFCSLFKSLLQTKTQNGLAALRSMCIALGDFCTSCKDTDAIDAVLTGILEHLLHAYAARKLFKYWNGNKVLRPILERGIALANGFK